MTFHILKGEFYVTHVSMIAHVVRKGKEPATERSDGACVHGGPAPQGAQPGEPTQLLPCCSSHSDGQDRPQHVDIPARGRGEGGAVNASLVARPRSKGLGRAQLRSVPVHTLGSE